MWYRNALNAAAHLGLGAVLGFVYFKFISTLPFIFLYPFLLELYQFFFKDNRTLSLGDRIMDMCEHFAGLAIGMMLVTGFK